MKNNGPLTGVEIEELKECIICTIKKYFRAGKSNVYNIALENEVFPVVISDRDMWELADYTIDFLGEYQESRNEHLEISQYISAVYYLFRVSMKMRNERIDFQQYYLDDPIEDPVLLAFRRAEDVFSGEAKNQASQTNKICRII